MRINTSLGKFYENNGINPELITCSPDKAYRENKLCDSKISKENLEEKLIYWIKRFDERDREYWASLFENYVYISEQAYKYKIWKLCEYIYEKLQEKSIKREQILFVTVSSPKGHATGGDPLRSHLLCVNLEWGMNKNQIVSDVEKMEIEILSDIKAVVFIDDILGTGYTLMNTIRDFLGKISENNFNTYTFYMTGILMTPRAIRHVRKKVKIEYELDIQAIGGADNYIRSCMKGDYIFKAEQKDEVEKIIRKYEEEIGIESEKSYVMGFQACKILLSFYYNTPNNTLCSFWKYTENNIPVFPRNEYVRPTLDAIQKRKNKNKNNAYRKGCVDKNGNV